MNIQGEGFLITATNAESFNKLLLPIQHSSVTNCTWIVVEQGLRIRWEDNSRIVQAEILLPAQFFYRYDVVGARIEFNVPMKLLYKGLGLMSVVADVQTEMRYECSQGELCFRSYKQSGEDIMREYVKLKTVQGSAPDNFADYWVAPEASFITQGSVLKNIVDDFPPLQQQPIVIQMMKLPQKVLFKAYRHGLDMEFEVPSSLINSFVSELQMVEHGYPSKFLRTVFCNVPSVGVQTKVSIDGNGLLKVMHILNLHNGEGAGGHVPTQLPTPTFTGSAQVQNTSATIVFLCKAQLIAEGQEPMDDTNEE